MNVRARLDNALVNNYVPNGISCDKLRKSDHHTHRYAGSQCSRTSLKRAIIQIDETGTFGQVYDRTLPVPRPDHVLINVAAVTLNPYDWKMSSAFPSKGASCGSHFAGCVVELGEHITHLGVGDRVAGEVHTNNPVNPTSGAYARYATVNSQLLWPILSDMSWGEAATIDLSGVGTVGRAAWHNLQLTRTSEAPVEKYPFVLVYGGSSANMTIVMLFSVEHLLMSSQIRLLSGDNCSPHNCQLVESLGAEKAFDDNDKLKYVMNIIVEARILKLCYVVIGRVGGRYVYFELIPEELASLRKTVKASWVLGIRMTGAKIALGKGDGHPANGEVGEWVRDGEVKAHPQIVHPGGYRAIAL
ncbi:putative zinc-binding dehydrogenase family oxidoreductase [Xylaria castorea]|nr:putative zinc-binding dehydrogenase family oxidoreductase [Xylaria castorea]